MNPIIKEQLKGKKLLFATVPAESHFTPLTGLAKYLQEAGCEVYWYTSPLFTEKLESLSIPHFTFNKAKDYNAVNLNDKFPERKLLINPAQKLNFDLINFFGERSVEYLEDIQRLHELFPFDLMVSDSMFSAIPLVRHKMNIPVISIGIIPLAEDSAGLAPYGMAFLPPENDEEQRNYTELHELVKRVAFRNSIDVYDEILKKNDVFQEKSILFNTLIKQSDLYLQIGTPGFEYKRMDLGENIRFIGALLPYSARGQKQKWFDQRLENYKKIILVTQGTSDTNKLIEPTLEAYQNTDVLIIAVTDGSIAQELKKKYTAENLIIEDDIALDEVMPYANIHVTNGRYNDTLFSIKHKLPMIAAGVHEGKNEVCSRIGYFNYGINLQTEAPSAEVIRTAAEDIFKNKLYKNNITRLAEEINSYDAHELSAKYIIELLNKKITDQHNRAAEQLDSSIF